MGVLGYLVNEIFPSDDFCMICSRRDDGYICSSCRTLGTRTEGEIVDDVSPISVVYSALYYDGFSKKMVADLKFNHKPYVAKAMSYFLCEAIERFDISGIDMVAYVPLHKRREGFRGYNQARLLAECVAENMMVELGHILFKCVDNRTQRGLCREERIRNVDGAYRARIGDLKGRSVLLIDDVWTTGSTMRECARVLRSVGAGDITGLCFAHRYG